MPASKTRWRSFDIISADNVKRIRQIMEDESRNLSTDKFKKVGDYFLSGMDTVAFD